MQRWTCSQPPTTLGRQLGLFICAMICTCKRASHCNLNTGGHRALEPVSAAEFQLAWNLQFLCSAPETITAMNRKELGSLDTSLRQGEIWMQENRCSAALGSTMGITALRVIMPTTRFAFLLMSQTHAEDHQADLKDVTTLVAWSAW